MKTNKYYPLKPIPLLNRKWPSMSLEKAPVWCSVDLRDGNQALITPMDLKNKLSMFKLLCEIGIKEIEVGFPSASDTEYEVVRTLIDENLIPDDVYIQVLVQARTHLIKKTFAAIEGAKNVIIHFYNSTSELQRRVVFEKDMNGIIDIAVNGARVIKDLAEKQHKKYPEMNIRYEYSPESFTGTELYNSIEICDRVLETLSADENNKVIINLPSTVESSMPNLYADQIEYFCTHLKGKKNAIISLHPHNDRGTGVASAELGILAGAERVEGTLFGNGERTGNVDLITLALNMYTQNIDCKLDFSDINRIREIYENATGMSVHPRQPYAGQLVFTAFSGSHQDAINKGRNYMLKHKTGKWDVPYLPIDPADIGRDYEPIIRINSQSGKGGVDFVMREFGFKMPKNMQAEFGQLVKVFCDENERELSAKEIFELFINEYRNVVGPYKLLSHSFVEEKLEHEALTRVHFSGTLKYGEKEPSKIDGIGAGPVEAFFNALSLGGVNGYKFVDYSEHALICKGADARGCCYINLKAPNGRIYFGMGISHNINFASVKAILCAINRSLEGDTLRKEKKSIFDENQFERIF